MVRTVVLESGDERAVLTSPIQPDGVSTDLTIDGKDPLGKFFTPPEMDFGEEAFLPAGTIETLANWLIRSRQEFRHLRDARISYYWKAKGGTSGGKVTLGKAQKPGGFLQWVTETDFIIFISADHCRDMAITNFQMEALVYHELCHCGQREKLDKDGEPTGEFVFAIVAHDVTTFHNEIAHYGGWLADLRQNRNTWEQLAIKEVENAAIPDTTGEG